MSEHTKGPWKAMRFGVGGSAVAIVAESDPTANLLGTFCDAENEDLAVFSHAPDGILAAAAPDLYEVTKAMLSCPTVKSAGTLCDKCREDARAALAKAEGGGNG